MDDLAWEVEVIIGSRTEFAIIEEVLSTGAGAVYGIDPTVVWPTTTQSSPTMSTRTTSSPTPGYSISPAVSAYTYSPYDQYATYSQYAPYSTYAGVNQAAAYSSSSSSQGYFDLYTSTDAYYSVPTAVYVSASNSASNVTVTSVGTEEGNTGTGVSTGEVEIKPWMMAAMGIAGVAIIAMMVLCCVCCRRRKRRIRQQRLEDDEEKRQEEINRADIRSPGDLTRDEVFDVVPLPPAPPRMVTRPNVSLAGQYAHHPRHIPASSPTSPFDTDPFLQHGVPGPRGYDRSSVAEYSQFGQDSELDVYAEDGSSMTRTLSTRSFASSAPSYGNPTEQGENPFDHPAYTVMGGRRPRGPENQTWMRGDGTLTRQNTMRTGTYTGSQGTLLSPTDILPSVYNSSGSSSTQSPITPMTSASRLRGYPHQPPSEASSDRRASRAWTISTATSDDDILIGSTLPEGATARTGLARGLTIVQHVDAGQERVARRQGQGLDDAQRMLALEEDQAVDRRRGEIHIPPTYKELYEDRRGVA